jgi:hypothetical protein
VIARGTVEWVEMGKSIPLPKGGHGSRQVGYWPFWHLDLDMQVLKTLPVARYSE